MARPSSSSLRVDVISIGTLARNRLWGEGTEVRTAHATCSLVRAGERAILVDPGLPAEVIAARLGERVNLKPSDIDQVFLTTINPSHTAGLAAFPNATVLAHELEIEHVRSTLKMLIEDTDSEVRERLEKEWAVAKHIRPAPDQLAPGVDLFPLFGVTPGTCGLLVSAPTLTTLIAGPAVGTLDHLLAGQVLDDPHDLEQAKESLAEVYEIADIIVPGYDNMLVNPRTRGM